MHVCVSLRIQLQVPHSFFFSSRRRHTRLQGDWSSDVCSSDLARISAMLSSGLRKRRLPCALRRFSFSYHFFIALPCRIVVHLYASSSNFLETAIRRTLAKNSS